MQMHLKGQNIAIQGESDKRELSQISITTCTATYAIVRGVTDLSPRRLATCPRVGALWLLWRFRCELGCSSRSFSLLILCAEVGEVKRNLNVCQVNWRLQEKHNLQDNWTYLYQDGALQQAKFHVLFICLRPWVYKSRPWIRCHGKVWMSITNILANTFLC